jgi:single-strand DNA-binding protein
MWSYVNTTIEGNVTREPTLKKTKTGKNVCEFSLAFHHPTSNEPDKGVSFIDVEAWERLAEICSDNISKGKRVLVVGALRQDRWEDDGGKKHSRHKIIGQEVRLVEVMAKQASEPVQKAV